MDRVPRGFLTSPTLGAAKVFATVHPGASPVQIHASQCVPRSSGDLVSPDGRQHPSLSRRRTMDRAHRLADGDHNVRAGLGTDGVMGGVWFRCAVRHRSVKWSSGGRMASAELGWWLCLLFARARRGGCVVVDPPGEGGWHGGSGVWQGKPHRCWGVDSGAVALVAQHILFLGEKNDGSGSQWRSGSFDGSVEVLGSGTAAIVMAVQPPASGTGHAEAAEAQQPVVARMSHIAAAVSRQAAAGESAAAGVVAAAAVEIGASSAADVSSAVEGGGSAEGQQQRQHSRQLRQCSDGSTRGRQQWHHSRRPQ